MTLTGPFSISSRLLPALTVGGATIQLERLAQRSDDNRDVFKWTLDLPGRKRPVIGSDLRSGCGGCPLQEAFESLLSFLAAAASSYPDGENADLFPKAVCEWVQGCSDELSMLQCELQETPGLLAE